MKFECVRGRGCNSIHYSYVLLFKINLHPLPSKFPLRVDTPQLWMGGWGGDVKWSHCRGRGGALSRRLCEEVGNL